MTGVQTCALPILKSRGAAAARIGKYKKRRRCRNENRGSIKSGVMLQREKGSIKTRGAAATKTGDRKSTRLNSSHMSESRMPSSA